MAEYTKPVIFHLGNEEYGVDITAVSSIEQYQQVIPVPNAQSYILGLTNLRGQIIPVYSLRRKFNMPDFAGNSSDRKLIIVRIKDTLMALDVDAVSDIQEFSISNVSAVPFIVKTDNIKYFDRVARIGDRIVMLIDVEYLLTDEELMEAQKMAEQFSNK